MDYVVRTGGVSYRVRIEEGTVWVDGTELELDLAPRGNGRIWSLRVGGESLRIQADREGRGEWRLGIEGAFHRVEVLTPGADRVRASAKGRAAGTGPSVLRAPMPGRIVGVDVEPGERVEKGQALVRMEAMKMENELGAPQPGVVLRVVVVAGEVVERDQLLVEFEAAGATP